MTEHLSEEQQALIVRDIQNTFNTDTAIESVFQKHNISDLEHKIELLKKCNSETQSFYTPNYQALSLEDKYLFEMEIVKHKTWEDVELYNKIEKSLKS